MDSFILSCSSIGYSLISVGFLNIKIHFCFLLDELHASLSNVTDTLEAMPAAGEDKAIIKLIKTLEKTGPLSGYGLFTIERSTLTSMISTSITYLIILVQFKMSFD